MSRHKTGCCGHSSRSHNKGCDRCGHHHERSHGKGQFKFSGLTSAGTSQQTVLIDYLADPGAISVAQTTAQGYPLALTQDITTLSVNVPLAIPAGQKLDVEVLRDGASLPTPLKVTYLAGEFGLKFAIADGQTFNGADDPSSSKLDVRATGTITVAPGALTPVALSAVVG